MAGRVVLVVDLDGGGMSPILEVLRVLPGVVVPPQPSDLLEQGLVAIIGNYLNGQEVGGGLAALAEPRPFLLAVRALADAIYSSALNRAGGDVIVDASPSMALSPHLATAVYPDAFVVAVGAESTDGAVARLLHGPRVLHLTRAQLTDQPS
ncbi:MAG: hypothetical protein QOF21_572, partial [Actinomycetota bacterium]